MKGLFTEQERILIKAACHQLYDDTEYFRLHAEEGFISIKDYPVAMVKELQKYLECMTAPWLHAGLKEQGVERVHISPSTFVSVVQKLKDILYCVDRTQFLQRKVKSFSNLGEARYFFVVAGADNSIACGTPQAVRALLNITMGHYYWDEYREFLVQSGMETQPQDIRLATYMQQLLRD